MQELTPEDAPKPTSPAGVDSTAFGKDSSKAFEKANRIEMDALWRFSVELQQQLDAMQTKINTSGPADFSDDRYTTMLTARIDECMQAYRGTFQREQAALVDRISAITLKAVEPLLHGELPVARPAERKQQHDTMEKHSDVSKLVCQAISHGDLPGAPCADKQAKLNSVDDEGGAAAPGHSVADFPSTDELKKWHGDVRLACAELAPPLDEPCEAGPQHGRGKSRQRLLVPVLHQIGHRVRALEVAVRLLQTRTADRGAVQEMQDMLEQLRPGDSLVPARLKELQDQLEALIARLKAGVIPGRKVETVGHTARSLSPALPCSPAVPIPSAVAQGPAKGLSHSGSLSAAAWGAVSSTTDLDGCRMAGQRRGRAPAVAMPAAVEHACIVRSRSNFRSTSPVPRAAATAVAPGAAGLPTTVLAAGAGGGLSRNEGSTASIYGSIVVASRPPSRAGSPAYGPGSPVACPQATAPSWQQWAGCHAGAVGFRSPPSASALHH